MSLTLVIANKAYSSWSFRPWILMRHFAIPFDEITIPLGEAATRENMLAYSPTGKCPCLRDGAILIWESLAIIEYIAEAFPKIAIWPEDRAARAAARALSAEMHSGFADLRRRFPMNMRRPVKYLEPTPEAVEDLRRIEMALVAARTQFGQAGPFLFGDFCAADAMFAPIVNRLHIYAVPVTPPTRAYMEAMMALPAFTDWLAGAESESWRIERYEAI
jgi:glutathione S-transferase